jgi:predicted nuclease of predicted toxin-antitoxin system
MRIYLDDNSAWPLLAKFLSNAGHDLQLPGDAGMTGKPDALHLAHAIDENRACLTRDYDDYLALHYLITSALGRHAGILVVREDNDPRRDLTPKGIVTAIRKLESGGVAIENAYIVLNHWR